MILKYLENESLTQINSKQLNECQHSCYPSTTICIYSDDGNLMANLDKPTKQKCYETMKGKIEDENDLKMCDFKNAIFPAKSYFNNITLEYTDESKMIYNLDNITDTYIDPNDQCFTIDSIPKVSTGIISIKLEFNVAKLSILTGSRFKLFLHYPGQFLRNSAQFRNPVFYIKSLNQLTMRAWSDITLGITHTILSINREDGDSECTNVIENHDEHWLNSLRKFVGCNPPYWKYIWNSEDIPDCKDSNSLKTFYEYQTGLSQPFTSNAVSEMYKTLNQDVSDPCISMELTSEVENNNENNTMGNIRTKRNAMAKGGTQMSVASLKKANETSKMSGAITNVTSLLSKSTLDSLNIEISFASRTYEERKEIRAYDSSSLFAEMGGYIGVFLGLSVLQGLGNVVEFIFWLRKFFSSSD